MRKIVTHPLFFFFLFLLIVFKEAIFSGKILAPLDTLVGSYFPWLDFKWGFPTGVPVKNPPISDVFSQFFIWKHLSVDMLRSGVLPLWNKFSFSGTPLLASIHWAVFFPGNLFLLLPKYHGWNIYLMASTFFSGLSMYLFIARFTTNKIARVAASLVFSLGGPMTTWFEFGTGVWAAAFLPMSLYLIDSFLISKKHKFLIFLSLSFASLILAGHAQMISYSLILFPAFTLWRLGSLKNAFSRPFLLVNLSLALGIGITAVQLLPTFAFFSESIRQQEKYSSFFRYGLSPTMELIRLWVPDFFGHPTTYNHWSTVSYHEYSSFLGTISLPLIFGLLFTKKRPKLTFFFIAFLVSLFLAVDNPISLYIFSLPIPLLTYSSASRVFFVTVFAAASLVGVALDLLFKKKLNVKAVVLTALVLVAIALFAVYRVPPKHHQISLRNSVIPIAILSSLIASFAFLRRHTVLLLLFLTLLLAADLGRYFRKYNPAVEAKLAFPETPVTSFLQKQKGVFRISRTKTNLIPPNTWMMYGLEAVEGYDPLRLLNYNYLFNAVNQNNYLSRPSRYSELENFDPRFLDALNVKYFISLKKGLTGDADAASPILEKHNYQQVFEDGSVVIYQSPTYLPRAYFVHDYRVAKSQQELAQLMSSPNFDPRLTAILEVTPSLLPETNFHGNVEIITHHANKVTLKVKTDKNTLLILADANSDGWRAYVDNQQTPIYQANGALRSIVVPPGTHDIAFRYFPDSFKLGLIVTLISVLISILSYTYLVLAKKT